MIYVSFGLHSAARLFSSNQSCLELENLAAPFCDMSREDIEDATRRDYPIKCDSRAFQQIMNHFPTILQEDPADCRWTFHQFPSDIMREITNTIKAGEYMYVFNC